MNTKTKTGTLYYADPTTGSLYSLPVSTEVPGHTRRVVRDLSKRWLIVALVWKQ